MAPTDAIQAIESALHAADADLSSVASRLHDEFRRLYPLRDPNSASSAGLNPLILLTRLRSLQSALPALRDELLAVHQQKADLAHLCRTQLSNLHTAALTLLPVAAPTLKDTDATPARNALYQQLSATLVQREQELDVLLAHFLKAHAQFVSLFPALAPSVSTDGLDLALLRAAAVNAPEQERTLKEVDTNATGPRLESSSDKPQPASTTPRKKQSSAALGASAKTQALKKRQAQPKLSQMPSDASSMGNEVDEVFEPVDRKVYNRLPRNLKIRAGKIGEINTFYEKVWNVLMQAGKAVPEKVLVKKVGEEDATRLDVLRGLTVITSTNQGWMLTKHKQQKTTKSLRTRV